MAVPGANDDDDDRPRSKRDRDDYDHEEPPRKRKLSRDKSKRGIPFGLLLGVGLIVVVVVSLLLLFGGRATRPKRELGPAPQGYTDFREPGLGIGAFLPCPMTAGPFRPNSKDHLEFTGKSGKHRIEVIAARMSKLNPPTEPDRLFQYYRNGLYSRWPGKYDVSYEPIQLDGLPGVKVTAKELPNPITESQWAAERLHRTLEEEKARIAIDGTTFVEFVVPNGQWIFVIGVSIKGGQPDAQILKTIADSIVVD